ncbi:polyphosphate kinase 2 family protein [Suttonella sp. R2A3]|uniref:polyphosphate kinase 2 family protein n=1 Tax=Suttonella sp. R2A3 TaxID=2908648 RepID=UPI001F3F0056|nr:polyphosphate kinase 2 family protein [Suttonella sp. R2A3]UJF25083.1 polyphosphate kinase 2 family protein [Suttonella sp. R2A3]
MSMIPTDGYRVYPGTNVSLAQIDTNSRKHMPDSKKQRKALLAELGPELDELQERLHAEGKRKVLLVLQGMDTAGKDGTIRHVFANCDPLGIRVAAFKAPSDNELARDYLWRVHQQVPRKGELVIFNRSHYEDVLITRVRGWIDEAEEARRFAHINEFERMLSETGTTIIKCFLHISKDEQRERLQDRLDRSDKNWKFNPGDLDDRKLWGNFQAQYEKVLNATSTEYAPWYIIPGDSKSTRNVIIINLLIETLKTMDLRYPEVDTSGWPKKIED